jgi:hypothetical protein
MKFQVRCYPCSSIRKESGFLCDISNWLEKFFANDAFLSVSANEPGALDLLEALADSSVFNNDVVLVIDPRYSFTTFPEFAKRRVIDQASHGTFCGSSAIERFMHYNEALTKPWLNLSESVRNDLVE